LGVEFVEGRPVRVLFPEFAQVSVADTAPPIHQQPDSSFKPALLENGAKIMVPLFIKTGDVIRVDLQAMKYMDRAVPGHLLRPERAAFP
jgi:elongation factor P